MLDLFKKFVQDQLAISLKSKILVAVSGGIDSMVLVHLCKNTFDTIAIAHCNFNLRGEESDDDEAFVNAFARENNMAFYCKQFNTEEFARNHKISIQEAARTLRFDWFEILRRDLAFDFIALGHNQNDTIETFLFNLTRGAGLNGLLGIPEKNERTIRPLLFAKRSQIQAFAEMEGIKFREDSSNSTTKYSRNKIRHEVLPQLKAMNAQTEKHILSTIQYLKDAKQILNEKIRALSDELIIQDEGIVKIDIQKLQTLPYQSIVLYELLQFYNFTPGTIQDIEKSLQGEPGKLFNSPTHQALKDRNHIIIREYSSEETPAFTIDETTSSLSTPIQLKIIVQENNNFTIPQSKNSAALDFDKIAFPLKLRKWKKGDKFIPLGMQHFKKISDFLIDEKISLFEKEQIWLLIDNKEHILWIIGQRIDNRFKITENTKTIYQIHCIK